MKTNQCEWDLATMDNQCPKRGGELGNQLVHVLTPRQGEQAELFLGVNGEGAPSELTCSLGTGHSCV